MQAAPDYPRAYLNLAIGLEARGQPGEAIRSYERARALDANDPLVNYNFAKLLAARRQLA